MSQENDQKVEDIIEENSASLGKLRELTEGLGLVVEHEKRIIQDAPPDEAKSGR